MDRRIFGIENEYGVTCTFRGQRRLSPDEVARYLFRKVVSWGRSSNVFLRNGARLYLDVGSHPEYATPECDDIVDLVAHDKAGERVLEGLLVDAERRLHDEGIAGDVYLFKNNTDSAGNSYGCHENYLVSRHGEFSKLADVLIPFLVTRQIIVGAGKVIQTPRGRDVLREPARRAHLGGRLQRHHPVPPDHQHPRRAARRRRALPPAARDRRRLEHERDDHHAQGRHLRPGAADDRGGRGDARPHDGEPDPGDPGDLARHDRAPQGPAGQRPRGQRAGHPAGVPQPGPRLRRPPRARDPADRAGSLDLWERTLKAVESEDFGLVEREIDWVIKWKLIERYRSQHGLPLSHPRIAQLDLAYHDIHRGRGLYYLLEKRGAVTRVTNDLQVFEAKSVPPQTTRARLRGEFIKRAQERRRDFTVDWVHLKLNDQAQRTVLCKDPFRAHDERVQKLIEGM